MLLHAHAVQDSIEAPRGSVIWEGNKGREIIMVIFSTLSMGLNVLGGIGIFIILYL